MVTDVSPIWAGLIRTSVSGAGRIGSVTAKSDPASLTWSVLTRISADSDQGWPNQSATAESGPGTGDSISASADPVTAGHGEPPIQDWIGAG